MKARVILVNKHCDDIARCYRSLLVAPWLSPWYWLLHWAACSQPSHDWVYVIIISISHWKCMLSALQLHIINNAKPLQSSHQMAQTSIATLLMGFFAQSCS